MRGRGVGGNVGIGALPGGGVHRLLSLASPDRESDVRNGGGTRGGGDEDEMMDKSERQEQLCGDGSTEGGERGRGGIGVPGPTPANLPAPGSVGGSELIREELGVWIEGQLAPVLLPLIEPVCLGGSGVEEVTPLSVLQIAGCSGLGAM